jgi:hypothetical protein
MLHIGTTAPDYVNIFTWLRKAFTPSGTNPSGRARAHRKTTS